VTDVVLDHSRAERIGLGEAVLCDAKTVPQLVAVLDRAVELGLSMLLTRLAPEQHTDLPARHATDLDYDVVSRTAFLGRPALARGPARIAVVTGGTSDERVAGEALRTLAFHGHTALRVGDVGVAGLWRLQARMAEIAECPVVIAIAGLEAALPTVLAGLVPGLVIGVPVSTGYGIAAGGRTALHSMLASCANGLVTVNIDNGFGAACAAMRALRAAEGSNG